MSLIFFLIQRALKRAFGDVAGPRAQPEKDHPRHDIVETLWAGMSVHQLRATFGAPRNTEKTAQGDEVWTYDRMHGQGVLTDIHITQGIVTKWVDRRDALPATDDISSR